MQSDAILVKFTISAYRILDIHKPSLYSGGAVVERWTRGRKVDGSTPGRGAIKSTRSTQPSILPG